MNKIFIIGSGTMGSGIAEAFAANGFVTYLYDEVKGLASSAKEKIENRLSARVLKGKLTEESKQKLLDNLHVAADFMNIQDADLVIEAIHEDMGSKVELFQKAEAYVSEDTILATNTSSLSITEMAAQLKNKERLIGMHFFNPAAIIPLVEVIPSKYTASEYVDRIISLSIQLNKTPVRVEESPGFVVNRLLIPMINEAVGLLADGVALKEDIDKAMVYGANHPMGPLALADLIGNDIVLSIMNTFYHETGEEKYKPHPYLKEMVQNHRLGKKTKIGFYNY